MAFTGQLNPNEIFAGLFNMIISQEVFAGNIKGTYSSLVNQAKTDGTLLGDTKLFYATDALKSHPWLNDLEAAQLLSLDRPSDPECQAITIDKFRQIRLTCDSYLSKRSWSTEGAFSSFNSIMLGWMRDTKRIYDSTLYNAYIGTAESTVATQSIGIDLTTATTGLSGREKTETEAKEIARVLADLFVAMQDVTRDYNDYGFLRSYDEEEIKVIWNASILNKIRKVDLPTIFHQEGLFNKFGQEVLPSRYFGKVITSSNISSYSDTTPAAGKPIASATGAYTPGVGNVNGTIRSLIEKDVTVSNTQYHVFPGDEIPSGATIVASTGNFLPGEVYIEQADIVCKIVVKLPPYLSAFEVGTSFFNPRSLTTSHFVTFGHNSLEFLKAYPMITVRTQ